MHLAELALAQDGHRLLHRLELRREMAEEWSLMTELHPGNLLPPAPHLQDRLNYVVDMALRVDPPRDRQPHQVHLCGGAEHQAANLYRSDSALQVKFCR